MTRHELRKLAESPLRVRRDDEFEPDWRHGLLAILGFCAMLAWIDARDNKDYLRQAAEKAHKTAQEARQELDSAPHIRWVGKGYECRVGRIHREWTTTVLNECQRIGNILQAARASE